MALGSRLVAIRALLTPRTPRWWTIPSGRRSVPDRPGRPGRNRTHNPRFWRAVLYQLSYWPVCAGRSAGAAYSFGLPVQRVLAAAGAVLPELDPPRVVAAVLLRRVVALLAFRAGQGDNRSNVFLSPDSASPPRLERAASSLLLFPDLDDGAGADGQAAFADGGLGTLLQRHRGDQLDRHLDVVAGHDDLHPFRQRD